MKRLIHWIFNFFGYTIQKNVPKKPKSVNQIINKTIYDSSMDSGLNRLKELKLDPSLIIDVGAAKGSWTQRASHIWPNKKYILIEPLSEQTVQISANLNSNPDVKIYNAVAGENSGTVNLNITDDLDGSGIYGKSSGNTREVKVVRLDDLDQIESEKILLKLDTHGYEIPIFEGGKKTLEKTVAIIVEVYGFYVSPTAKLFHEISDYLDGKNFRLFDIVDIMRRPKDHAFWQADAVYLRNTHPVFRDNNYK